MTVFMLTDARQESEEIKASGVTNGSQPRPIVQYQGDPETKNNKNNERRGGQMGKVGVIYKGWIHGLY